MVRILMALGLFLPSFATAAPPAGGLTPGVPYYYDHFDPSQRPWEPGQGLNIEEVFKNYQFYEIVADGDGKGITVHSFIKGSKAASEKYRILPDGSLQQSGQ